jgi:hypothetical protein
MPTSIHEEPYRLAAFEQSVAEHLIDDLVLYITDGLPQGHFMTAVLSNDLKETFRRGDEVSLRRLRNLMSFLYNDAPSNCWGSPDLYKAWVEQKGLRKYTG